MDFISYRHVVNLGDLISALPGVKHLWKTTGKKAIIYQQLGRPGEYYPGADHPTKDGNGNMVCMNQQMFDMLRPLLLEQEYIEDFRVYQGERVDYDLDVVRRQVYCGAPHFPLHKWTWMAYPEMACDLSENWLKVDIGEQIWELPDIRNNVVINFTERYRNYNINYFFLKQYEQAVVFVGTEQEHQKFQTQWGVSIRYQKAENFLQLARYIVLSKFFLGNQSFCWHIAQATHTPRILELDPCMQNCNNYGANGYDFYHQHALEFYFQKLFNE